MSGEKSESRTTHWVSIVVAATAVVGAVVGLLTYLQSRPSGLDDYRDQVATLCEAGAARQVKIDAAITATGYDRQLFTDLLRQAPETAATLVDDLRELRPPDELAAEQEDAIAVGEEAVELEREYVRSLTALPDSEFAKHWPQLPGDAGPMNARLQEFQAALVVLSGGKCGLGLK